MNPPARVKLVDSTRYLVVSADDFGIGPATSQGILELAAAGAVTCTVLLVTSPHAENAVRAWRQAGAVPELGWHPCLTLDRPVTPPQEVPSLVGADGRFHPLGVFIQALCRGRIRAREIRTELNAQYVRFQELVGVAPSLINTHHHIQVFAPVGAILEELLARARNRPYYRRIQEPLHTLVRVPGARAKRLVLSLLGRYAARRQGRAGFDGNDWLAGITDPPWVADPDCLVRWLKHMPGRVVELTCHPGHFDPTLAGRDGSLEDGQLLRRTHEFARLREAGFRDACRRAAFTLVSPSELRRLRGPERTRAA